MHQGELLLKESLLSLEDKIDKFACKKKMEKKEIIEILKANGFVLVDQTQEGKNLYLRLKK